MKIKLIAGAIIVMASLTTTTAVQASNIAQSVCNFVAADDKKRMRIFLKANKLKIRSIFDSVQCNGKNLLEFADSRGSINTGTYMIGKLPKKAVNSSKGGLTNADLIAKAAERTGA